MAHYIVYLDEFGHIGPFVSRTHVSHNTSPVFGLGGFALPSHRIRGFSSFFYQLKCNLLAWEISEAAKTGVAKYHWEKKGSQLYADRNVYKYRQLRTASYRLFNAIFKNEGFVFYTGVQKHAEPSKHNSKALFSGVLRDSIRKLDNHFSVHRDTFLLLLDHQDGGKDFREGVVAAAAGEMFTAKRQTLLEAPIQAESYLFQNLQCADWLCGIINRIGCFQADPAQYKEHEWVETFGFVERLKRISIRSSIRARTPEQVIAASQSSLDSSAGPLSTP